MSHNQLYRGSLTTIIMRLLEKEGKMYGYEITQKVKEITEGKIDIKEGALYPSLHKLQAAGHLKVDAKKVDNRIRKYYSLTPQGQKETVYLLAELNEYIENMQAIMNPKIAY
ncbi:PadR family transcriptional regulator [Nonlabens dokdonensis]|uniref:PadR family transcriptional regulator n=1 Tax=Nonlabens dokdonensis TaxID=328515 RepID=UPI0026EEBB87|nr:PadR family transcriptional regulator [Nonlabens dokdonensis]